MKSISMGCTIKLHKWPHVSICYVFFFFNVKQGTQECLYMLTGNAGYQISANKIASRQGEIDKCVKCLMLHTILHIPLKPCSLSCVCWDALSTSFPYNLRLPGWISLLWCNSPSPLTWLDMSLMPPLCRLLRTSEVCFGVESTVWLLWLFPTSVSLLLPEGTGWN